MDGPQDRSRLVSKKAKKKKLVWFFVICLSPLPPLRSTTKVPPKNKKRIIKKPLSPTPGRIEMGVLAVSKKKAKIVELRNTTRSIKGLKN